MTTLTNTQPAEKVANLPRAGALAALAAVIGGVASFLLMTTVLGINVVMPPEMTPMPLMAVIASSFVGAVGGTVVYALLGRFTSRPVTIFRVVALAFLALSMLPPLTMPDLDSGSRIAMIVMHIAVGLPVIAVLTTVGRAK